MLVDFSPSEKTSINFLIAKNPAVDAIPITLNALANLKILPKLFVKADPVISFINPPADLFIATILLVTLVPPLASLNKVTPVNVLNNLFNPAYVTSIVDAAIVFFIIMLGFNDSTSFNNVSFNASIEGLRFSPNFSPKSPIAALNDLEDFS